MSQKPKPVVNDGKDFYEHTEAMIAAGKLMKNEPITDEERELIKKHFPELLKSE